MTGTFDRELMDVDDELEIIKKYIGDNKFHRNSKFLLSYSIVKSCGAIEKMYKQLILDYLSDGAKEDTKQYLSRKTVESSSNPTMDNITKILKEINGELCRTFKCNCDKYDKENLNSLVKNRNTFAHGGNISISIETVISYYESSKKVMNCLEETLNTPAQ